MGTGRLTAPALVPGTLPPPPPRPVAYALVHSLLTMTLCQCRGPTLQMRQLRPWLTQRQAHGGRLPSVPHCAAPSASTQVRAGESLMKLVSDLKQFLILNDFPSVNEAIDQRNQQLRALREECDRKLVALRDEVSIDLYELEEEYYSSRYK